MQSWDRPPAGIAPAEFFERWLPEAFAASGRRVPPGAPTVRASISGSEGGAWDLAAEDGALVVHAAGREPPDVWIRQSVADLRVVLGGLDPDLPELVPAGWSVQQLFVVDPADVDLLRQISGRLLFELEGNRRRRWAIDVGIGKTGVSAGRPRATLRLDATTFEGLRSGAVPPMQPLFDGRLKLEGDRALAMQMLLLVGSRLGRR
jgi:hypothetical protein